MDILDDFKQDIISSTSVSPIVAEALSYFVHGIYWRGRFDGLDSNLYMLVIGPSSISHKSTATTSALSILDPRTIIPLGTYAGLRKSMGTRGTIVFHEDEFGRFLKGVKGGSEGTKKMVDALNSIYGGKPYTFPEYYNKKAFTVSRYRVAMIASTTLDAFKDNCTREMLEGGLMKRFLVIMAGKTPYRSRRNITRGNPKLPDYKADYCDITLSDKAWKMHDKFMEEKFALDDSVAGVWQRAEDHLFKLLSIIAMANSRNVLEVEDWIRAMGLVKHSVDAQLMLLAMLKK